MVLSKTTVTFVSLADQCALPLVIESALLYDNVLKPDNSDNIITILCMCFR